MKNYAMILIPFFALVYFCFFSWFVFCMTMLLPVMGLCIIYQIYYIHVPTNFENKLQYRIQGILFKSISAIARVARFLRLNDEFLVFRQILYLVLKLMPKYKPNNSILITDTSIDGVVTKIFRLKKCEHGENLPCIIFFHGGGFVFGKPQMDSYNFYLDDLTQGTSCVVISVIYKKAPEFPYPQPFEECFRVVKYVFKNPHEFKIDINRVALLGDSAGGNIVTTISHHLAKNEQFMPKLQCLIYPWMQMWDFNLPSHREYGEKNHCPSLTPAKLALWYIGRLNLCGEIEDFFQKNYHRVFVEDKLLKAKYDAILDPIHIPAKYKINKAYYPKHETQKIHFYPKELDDRANLLIKRVPTLKDDSLKMFNKDFSPLLEDDHVLKKLPQTYLCVVEFDMLKDEILIYSERLRKNGVNVEVYFYENAFHGMACMTDETTGFMKAREILKDMIGFINANL